MCSGESYPDASQNVMGMLEKGGRERTAVLCYQVSLFQKAQSELRLNVFKTLILVHILYKKYKWNLRRDQTNSW